MTTNEPAVADRSGAEAVLEVEGARVTFEMDRGTSRVLDDVDLTVRRGETLGVVGESGSGKSMLASSMLDAVVDPGRLTGEITYYRPDGEAVEVLSLEEEELKSLRWEEISFVVQAAQSAFNPTMTVEGHFRDTLTEHDRDVQAGLERGRELLSDLYLNPQQVLESYPHELSGGMKQRALIALSLVLEPELLVMDEPTAALDLLMQRSIISLLADLKRKYDLTLVFITHDLALVSDLAERLAVMYAFQVVELGPTDEIVADAAHPYTRALLNSVPTLTTPDEEMTPIPGSSPDPVNVPEGCSYHPRCPLADGTCRADDPDYHPVDHGHDVKCFHWEDADDAIPRRWSTGDGGETRADGGEP
jgi:oligopeptide/dipeptide ABC transporter ATP-binding protein